MENEKATVALTGASGSMGGAAYRELVASDAVGRLRLLFLDNKKERRLAKKLLRGGRGKAEAVFGDVADPAAARRIVSGADYVINCAAVIPPLSDHRPELADRCNRFGAKTLTDAILDAAPDAKLVHISTVALYGHRNYLHPWGRVGDPLLPSAYDFYAASKMKGERYVLESELRNFVVLRQTGILHKNMLKNNMKDGLMFHTGFNVPLEWITAEDSGVMLRRLVEYDRDGTLSGFWNKVYNVGGGAKNRCTGYDTFEKGFRLIGGSVEKFLKPGWNSIRNFHGLWFSDGDVLDGYLHYIRTDVDGYWREVLRAHPYYRLARLLPPRLVGKLFIEPLLRDENAPKCWIEQNDAGRIRAFFGSRENLDKAPARWKDYPVLAKGEIADGSVDFEAMRDVKNVRKLGYLLPHGYDDGKPDAELTIEDVKAAAVFRGGKCLSESMEQGNLRTRLRFECADGHRFSARAYTVLKAGHWCPVCSEPPPWQFDCLAKKNPYFAAVWYDTHAKNERFVYGAEGAAADDAETRPKGAEPTYGKIPDRARETIRSFPRSIPVSDFRQTRLGGASSKLRSPKK